MNTITLKKIKEVYIKSIYRDGLLNILIIRPISLIFALFFTVLKFSPNQVTLLSFCANIFASYFFFTSEMSLGIFFLFLGLIWDCSDGQMAILQDKKSKWGAFLDPFVDRISDVLIFGGISIGYFLANPDETGIIFLYIFYLIFSYFNLYLITEKNGSTSLVQNTQDQRKEKKTFFQKILRYIHWDGGFTGFLFFLFFSFNILQYISIPFILIFLIFIINSFFSIFKHKYNS